jgi:hypothetical protein
MLNKLIKGFLYFLIGASWALMLLGVLIYLKYFWYLNFFLVFVFILPGIFLNFLIKYIFLILDKN